MKHLCAATAAVLFACGAAWAESPATIGIDIAPGRQSFYRNEKTVLSAVAKNTSRETVRAHVTMRLDPLRPVEKRISIPPDGTAALAFPVDCSLLKPGDYRFRIDLDAGGTLSGLDRDISIAQPPNPQRFPVVYWGSSGDQMDWGLQHGFNTFAAGSIPAPNRKSIENYRTIFDRAVRNRVNFGVQIHTVQGESFKSHPEMLVVPRTSLAAEGTSDNQKAAQIFLREPLVVKQGEDTARMVMEILGGYPSFFHTLINSEYWSAPSYSPLGKKLLKEEAGLDLYDYLKVDPRRPPKTAEEGLKLGLPERIAKAVPVNGIIEDDNPFYRFSMWYWKRGLGDAQLNERIGKVVKERRKDAVTWHDPFRLAPVYGTHTGLDCIGQWTYTHPDPKYTGYIEAMIAAARPEHQKVMPDVTVWEYQNWLAPTDSGVVIMPEHILRECCWIALSRRPDMICHYIPSRYSPDKPASEFTRDPKTFEMMKWMGENVYRPLGPAILEMERAPRKAALLCSASSILYPEVEHGGWPNEAINPFLSMLMAAHMPTDVIFDETITRYGLDGYDILFLPLCETLTRSVYEKILAFKKKGGIVIADRNLRADIPLDYRGDFNFNHRKRQLGDLVLKGEGVTADEDREIMRVRVAEVRRALGDRFPRYVDSDSFEVVFNVLERGPVKYVFMVNDRRTYGDRFGRWKTFHECGVEQTVTARLETGLQNPVVYDLREGGRVDSRLSGDSVEVTRTLDPCDGTILAVYPDPLTEIRCDVPKTIRRGGTGTVTVRVLDSRGRTLGTQPIRLTVLDSSGAETAYSDWYATSDGVFRLTVDPALNDREGVWTVKVVDLTTGMEKSKTFAVR